MSQPTLYILNKNYSTWSMRAWIAAKFVGFNFEEVLVPFETNEVDGSMIYPTTELARISASKKVPLLHHNDLIIWDSLAISEYLNELFPQKNLFPQNQLIRAFARSICSEMHSGFTNLRSEMTMNMRSRIAKKPNIEVQKDINRILEIWQNCFDRFGGKFLLGEFTIADAFFAPVVSRFITYGVEVGSLAHYIETASNHPLYLEWLDGAAKEKIFTIK